MRVVESAREMGVLLQELGNRNPGASGDQRAVLLPMLLRLDVLLEVVEVGLGLAADSTPRNTATLVHVETMSRRRDMVLVVGGASVPNAAVDALVRRTGGRGVAPVSPMTLLVQRRRRGAECGGTRATRAAAASTDALNAALNRKAMRGRRLDLLRRACLRRARVVRLSHFVGLCLGAGRFVGSSGVGRLGDVAGVNSLGAGRVVGGSRHLLDLIVEADGLVVDEVGAHVARH